MKHKFLLLLVIASLLLTSFSIHADASETDDTMIQEALDLVKSVWQDYSDQYPEIMPAPFVDIKNTRSHID